MIEFLQKLKELESKNNESQVNELYEIWIELSIDQMLKVNSAHVKSLDRSVKNTQKYFGRLISII